MGLHAADVPIFLARFEAEYGRGVASHDPIRARSAQPAHRLENDIPYHSEVAINGNSRRATPFQKDH
jgi:hypothetical protein